MKTLTIFTAPKPFLNQQIAMLQRNAIQSWVQLGTDVEVILLGNDEGIGETARDLRVIHVPDVATNSLGTPLVDSIFKNARAYGSAETLAYINADILLMDNFLSSAKLLGKKLSKFLAVGQRWDLAIGIPLVFSSGWQERLWTDTQKRGRLHPSGGSDYFIFPRLCFREIPEFSIGRAGWDNWMIYQARQKGWPVVDATPSIDIIHQDHDYSHLPGGQAHYRLPESNENVRLAGGERNIFTLMDTNYSLNGKAIHPAKISWKKFLREVEIYPQVSLHSNSLTQLFFAIFHPKKAYHNLRQSQVSKNKNKKR